MMSIICYNKYYMDSFNKVISFVLGLVVVLVFFAFVTGKINLKSKTTQTSKTTLTQKNNGGFFGFFKSTTPTPTQKPPLTTNNAGTISGNNIYKQNNQIPKSSDAKSIPSTGLPTLFIPMLLSGLVGGNFLRKMGKK